MIDNNTRTLQTSHSLEMNRVLRNTYLLLGMTFLFSALVAGVAMVYNLPPLSGILFLIGAYGLLFATQYFANSSVGLVLVFAFTGFMGYGVGPLLNYYIHSFSNGAEMVMMSLGATGVIFFALSGYVLATRKDFSFLGGMMFIGMMVLLLAMLASVFFSIPGLHLAISAAFVLFSSAMILFQTSEIIHGGERNYILATITLFVSIYNLFMSLLSLFSAFAGDDR